MFGNLIYFDVERRRLMRKLPKIILTKEAEKQLTSGVFVAPPDFTPEPLSPTAIRRLRIYTGYGYTDYKVPRNLNLKCSGCFNGRAALYMFEATRREPPRRFLGQCRVCGCADA